MQTVGSNLRHLGAVLLCSVLAACGARDEAPSDTLIYGGQAVAADQWQHVAALTSQRSNGAHEIICTATLISSRHILTAGHCLDAYSHASDKDGARTRLGIYFGSGEEGGNLPSDTPVLPIAAVAVHEALRLHPGGNADLAVLTLKDPVTTIKPTPITASYDDFLQQVRDGTAVKLVGFGRREDNGLGRKFMADAAARKVRAWESFAGADGRDSCSGDSGGPGYVAAQNGNWTQYAVVSRGSSFQCGAGGVMTHIAPHACWITQVSGLKLPGTSTQCASAPSYTARQLATVDFAHVCSGGKGTSRFQRETVNRLKARFNTRDCGALAAALSAPELNLDDLLLRDLSPLAPFKTIERLSLTNNLVSDPKYLLQWPALTSLALFGNDLAQPAQDLRPLSERGVRVTGLTAQIGRYGQTAFLAACSDPNASDDTKKTVAGIKARMMADDCATANSRLLMATTLNLSGRQLSDLSPLAGLPNLKTLDISQNPVRDLSPLAGLDSLKTLTITGTGASDLTPLAVLIDSGLVVKQ